MEGINITDITSIAKEAGEGILNIYD